ncbi:hypothetical protein DK254_09575 [Pseudomonas sp. RW407]|uniref:AAA family ATPase n=1 Tax=Pseudomonas sp. RW407 TaxID=2202894 RepID=UPI000D70218B|nr:AAA family ATPase [Pseudomonas sp. RW407]PWU30340.1 hypothetical protein DK254_09575 [Pseudomonas sp. RW407]
MSDLLESLSKNIENSINNNKPPFTTYIIGNNGTGKSRLLAKVCEHYNSPEQTEVKSILCISNSITDKFDFLAGGKSKYLGARSVNNAIFWSSLDREIAKQASSGIKPGKRKYFERLEKALGIEFIIKFPDAEKRKNITRDNLGSLVDGRKLKGSKITDKISLAGRKWLTNVLPTGIEINKVTIDRGKDLLAFLSLNPEVRAMVKKNGICIRFQDLSSGEQNRISTALKILANAEEKLLILIDEPEISLHVQWQAEFHKFLEEITENLKNYHILIATHSPIIVSEATKGKKSDAIVILDPIGESGRVSDEEISKLKYEATSANKIQSFEDSILSIFRTATYNTTSIDIKIAKIMLEASDQTELIDNKIEELKMLKNVKNIPSAKEKTIDEAIHLIEKHLSQLESKPQ